MSKGVGAPSRVIGRYALHDELATGGMASIHIGRLLGPVGFARTVVVKKLHPQFAKDPEFVSMFVDEARLAARIRHTNVVQTLDVVATEGELFLVMDYVHGESLSRLLKTARADDVPVPWRVAVAIAAGMLHGLHAAHEAKSERGEPLGLVHRDVSPQNVSVGVDGVARVLDFGVAKAAGRVHTTRDGSLKGKIAYMAPEQLQGKVSRQTDVFAAAIVLWESLAGRRLFEGDNEGELLTKLVHATIDPPSNFHPGLPAELDAVVMHGLERDPTKRFATAREMALALERQVGAASASEVGEWVERVAHRELERRADLVAAIELSTDPTRAASDIHREISGPFRAAEAGKSTIPSEPPTLVTPPTAGHEEADEAATVSQPASSVPPRDARADARRAAEDPSSVGLASRSGPPPFLRRRLPRAAWVISAVVVLLGGLVAIVVAVTTTPTKDAVEKPAPVASPASSSPASSSPASSSVAANAPPTLSAAVSAASIVEPTTTSASTSSISTAKPKPIAPPVAGPHAPTATATAAAKPKPSSAPKPDCNPKYYFDTAGVKVWKPECF